MAGRHYRDNWPDEDNTQAPRRDSEEAILSFGPAQRDHRRQNPQSQPPRGWHTNHQPPDPHATPSQDPMAPYSPSTESPVQGATKPDNGRDQRGPRRTGFTSGMRDLVRKDIRSSILKSRGGKKKKRIAQETAKDKLKARIAAFYQSFIIETILRRKPLAPSKAGRHIPLNEAEIGSHGLIDERRGKPYISNFIRSSRYTIWSFIPAQLIFQFSKLGNFYFLVIGIIQMIPGLSTVGRWTTIVPLGIFVAFSMLKEGYDDWRRYELDKVENRATAWVLAHGVRSNSENRPKKFSGKGWKGGRPVDENEKRVPDEVAKFGDGQWIPIQWQHVQVGDIVRLQRNDGIPADIALLHATGPNGIAYIDTMALDGETNLKSKQASPLFTKRCADINGLLSTRATVVSEDPNMDLYTYDGKVVLDGETLPLTQNNVVYRGSTLRNTSLAIGLVINSGEECKIRMNANKNARAKTPAMQSVINKMILLQIVGVIMISAGLTAGYYLWEDPQEQISFYLYRRLGSTVLWDASVPAQEIFIGFVIMFNTLIPLSLYISLEIVKLGQFFMMQDAEMYDPTTNTPMVANTTTILENLGQVNYVFSDKTGTLTENIMRFRKMSIAGVACLHDMDLQQEAVVKETHAYAATKKPKKGKALAMLDAAVDMAADITFPEAQRVHVDDKLLHQRPTAVRTATTGSVSQWKSSARPNEEPELKTEDLLEYIRARPNSAFSRKAQHFILCIALCHTCLPEINEKGEHSFQAASPDELALVEAARDLGLLVIDRPSDSIKLQVTNPDGNLSMETYQVLDVIEFSSKRKRMSIVVRMPDGRLCVLCKGADNVIIERLKQHQLAEQTTSDISKRAMKRRTFEQDKAFKRQSLHGDGSFASPRNSGAFSRPEGWRSSMYRQSNEIQRLSRSEDLGTWLHRRETEEMATPRGSMDGYSQSRSNLGRVRSQPERDFGIDESIATNDSIIFQRCFEQVNDFASEGLRTLLYGYRYIDDKFYSDWKQIYHEAETSLIDRQSRIEDASELIEQKLELAGATAIEDKLQEGVPDTIDKLRRANVKVWMLTGDKRETAINIGHSARLCRPFSEIFILDSVVDDLEKKMTETIETVGQGTVPHSVLVIDGQTLAAIDDNEELALLFYDLVILVDSVICCRASPSQKAHLVKSIRRYVPKTMTLAIGDGANDIGMILEAHVGVGISGREGLQAARISDYSFAQFRFLQKLLFVHGRWNYLRTGRYVLATFWKEIVFYIVQAHFQMYAGYTGTSLYENWSLTVFNVLFTSLAVILPGILEKDLSQDTLLAVPELYTFGQRNEGFNFLQYFGWAIMGAIDSCIIWYPTWAVYRDRLFNNETSLYSLGVACFTVSVLFINIKLL